LVCANLAAIVPGLKPPTGHLETPAALAAIVFFSIHYFGVRSRGVVDYVRRYTKPNLLLFPLNVLSEITRTFSLMVRLFGNMMSHEMVIAIIVFLAGLLLPIPFMLLGILIGLIQAYIFTVLAAVFIGAAVGTVESE
ncbi:MAG: F0F1 ATP synthase subunit A, partial [Rhodospirillales bacterium]|nr:F0F1 ATP synthase subunit A [Rhodospirillales bacterium]